MNNTAKPKVILLFGPTATGKSDLGINISKMFDGEIISADSMQIYRRMDIGTAKLSQDKWNGITHHMIDVVDPEQLFTAADFYRMALDIIDDILNRKKVPFVVGGSGLYFKTLLYGIFEGPPRDEAIRNRLELLYKEKGADFLHKRLVEIDKTAAQKIHPNDERRIVRALEVFELTGTKISEYWNRENYEPSYNFLCVGLDIDRQELYERINQRCDIMLNNGLIDEVKRLIKEGLCSKHSSMQAIGYSQILDYLADKIDYNEMVRIFKRDSRRLAKRQFTLFKRLDNVEWFNYKNISKIEKRIKEFLI